MDIRRKGQALVELAIGMFVVALVLGGLLAFGKYIVESLDEQRTVRAEAGRGALGSIGGEGAYSSATKSTTVIVSPIAADYIFGSTEVDVKESVHIPLTGIDNIY